MISWRRFLVVALMFTAIILAAYWAGLRHHNSTIRWYSDMTSQLQGHKIYLIDTPVVCPNRMVRVASGQTQMVPGKEIGKLQLDVNLQSGELKVITNTVPKWFDCEK